MGNQKKRSYVRLGQFLRQLRLARGWSPQELANRLNEAAGKPDVVDRAAIYKWEVGQHRPKHWMPWLAEIFGVPIEDLQRAGAESMGIQPATSYDSEFAPNLFEAPQSDGPLADALLSFSGPPADFFCQQLSLLMAADGNIGPRRTLPQVKKLLEALHNFRGARSDLRRELTAVGARCAEFAGWLCRDMGAPRDGAHWYDRSMEYAQVAGDLPMQGYVLLRKSQMAFDQRDAALMLALAQASLSGPWGLPNRVRAEAMQQEARGYAMTGAPPSTIERKLDKARELLETSAVSIDSNELGASFDDGAFTLRTAICYTEAGQAGAAAELFREVLEAGTLSPRDQGYFLARRASALAMAREPDAAASEGLEALRLASMTSSARTVQEISYTLRTLHPWKSKNGTRQLSSALNALNSDTPAAIS